MADDELEESWQTVLKWYYQPLLREKAEIVPMLPGVNTAQLNMQTTKTLISQEYLNEMQKAGFARKEILRGIITHEVGHYVVLPRELASLLFLSQISHDTFKEPGQADAILQFYMDVVNDTDSFRSEKRRPDLAKLCIAEYKALQRKIDEAPAAQKKEVEERSRMDVLMKLWSQKISGVDMGVKGDAVLDEKLKGMQSIVFDCKDDYAHAVSLVTFGELVKDILPKPGQQGDPSTRYGDIAIKDFSDKQIQDALNYIISKHGKERYEMVQQHLKDILKDRFQDPFNQGSGKLAALSSSTIQLHPEEVPYYARLASTYPLYIVKKPLKKDARELYPSENVSFQPGDPLSKLNQFSAPHILPGIIKRWEDAMGTRVETQYCTPNLGIWLDTSGSMKHPKHKSFAVLMGFILAKNYHANGAKLFLANFSADILFIGPTRDLDVIQQGLCAYWGGGTVLNIDKLRAYFETYGCKESKEIVFTDAEDYKKMLQQLTLTEQERFLQKAIAPKLDKHVQELYERTDNVLVSDGYIGNVEELVGYMNTISPYSRNTLILISNEHEYARWQKMPLKNTNIVLVEKEEDCLGIAIGKARKLVEL
ncbi:hypothetical protein HY639_04515 [Candidatus Woesearchaeota archaeon]|nr:hypothetical protein [Candidatus Woesearchaeota archaeon]